MAFRTPGGHVEEALDFGRWQVEGVEACQECGERAVVGLDRSDVDVFAWAVLVVSADTEDNGGNAPLTEIT